MRLSRRPESAGPEPLTEGELLGVRGVVGDPGAAYQLKDLLPPDNLRGVTQAAARLARAIGLPETIFVFPVSNLEKHEWSISGCRTCFDD